ncbi:MAG: hypothetical protein WBD22_01760 [Pyrinomonadaceae bacterium]
MDTSVLLRLSLQRAMLGEVTQNLIAVTAGITDSRISLWAYFNEQATESETDRISCIGGEIIADFPDGYEIAEQVFINEEQLVKLEFWGFVRAETKISQ